MNRLLSLLLFLPLISFAQRPLTVGLNVTPLVIGTLDLQVEKPLGKITALQFGAGFRAQNSRNKTGSFLRMFDRFHALENNAFYFSVGGRIFEMPAPDHEYSYMAFDVFGIYYNETIKNIDHSIEQKKGFNVGASLTFGMVFPLPGRFTIDLGLRMGYFPPREEPPIYFLPGIGFTTLGLDLIGVKGGHVLPLVMVKYNLIKDKRTRIREQE